MTAKPDSILMVADGSSADAWLLAKAMHLASQCGASLELFSCDAEHAYELKHAYDPRGVESAREASLQHSRAYLANLKAAVRASQLPIAIDVACESPLYDSIVHKIVRSHPQLVLKSAGGVDRPRRRTFDANDWQLMRNSPATLMLSRGRLWSPTPRFIAALDVSGGETAGLVQAILETAGSIATACGGVVELAYAEPAAAHADSRPQRRALLEQLGADARVDPGRVHFLLGEPREALQSLIRAQNYDVIVIGALTHRPSMLPLVGTLTASLMDAVDSDFILVRRGADAPAAATLH